MFSNSLSLKGFRFFGWSTWVFSHFILLAPSYADIPTTREEINERTEQCVSELITAIPSSEYGIFGLVEQVIEQDPNFMPLVEYGANTAADVAGAVTVAVEYGDNGALTGRLGSTPGSAGDASPEEIQQAVTPICQEMARGLPAQLVSMCVAHISRYLGAVDELSLENRDAIFSAAKKLERGNSNWMDDLERIQFSSGSQRTTLEFGSKAFLSREEVDALGAVEIESSLDYQLGVTVPGSAQRIVLRLPFVPQRGLFLNPLYFVDADATAEWSQIFSI
jgi:hypothetical protein